MSVCTYVPASLVGLYFAKKKKDALLLSGSNETSAPKNTVLRPIWCGMAKMGHATNISRADPQPSIGGGQMGHATVISHYIIIPNLA
jgi:hypothetical protein